MVKIVLLVKEAYFINSRNPKPIIMDSLSDGFRAALPILIMAINGYKKDLSLGSCRLVY